MLPLQLSNPKFTCSFLHNHNHFISKNSIIDNNSNNNRYSPTLSMARTDPWATRLESTLLTMQTPIGEVVAKPEVEVMLWTEVRLLSVTSYTPPEVVVVDIRISRIIAGKRKRQDNVLIVIRFMTSLKKIIIGNLIR